MIQIEEVGHVLVGVVWSQYSLPNLLSLRHQLIERRAYGGTWFYLAEWMCKLNVLVVVLRQLSG